MFKTIIQKTLRVPTLGIDEVGSGEEVARQLDSALMSIGFKMSRELLEHYTHMHPSLVVDQGKTILQAVRELVGDHIQHNTYFIQFPDGVPDTLEFWWTEILRLFFTGQTHYGRYQHTYEEMLALHDEFLPSATDRVTILHLGKSLLEEIRALYYQLASSPVPLGEADRALVKELTEVYGTQISLDYTIPMRETLALINAVRVQQGQSLIVDTVTDILRVACELSGGDSTLQGRTRFRSLPRAQRRRLLASLDDVLSTHPGQLEDIMRYQEEWKRVGERLHPHEYKEQYEDAYTAFMVARGEKKVMTLAAQVEASFQKGDTERAITLLARKPGILVRSVDRVLRYTRDDRMLSESLTPLLPHVSGRVLLSLREYLQNRTVSQARRIFTNSKGKAWMREEGLQALPYERIQHLCALLDQEILSRLPAKSHLVVDPDIVGVALPLSEKEKPDGFAILPRGSHTDVGTGFLRFFLYWKQTTQRTDYDLSAILLDEKFQMIDQLSYTNLRSLGGTHSGDLTDATHGATEFIDIHLSQVRGTYLVPQINIFAGEEFTQVESCFFGLMQRDLAQQGKPFEPQTVRFKSDIRGSGKVALPLVFKKEKHGGWSAVWTHLYLKGQPRFNRIEGNHLTTSMLTQGIVERGFLCVEYLLQLLQQKAQRCSWYEPGMDYGDGRVTYIGLERPEGLPQDAIVYTLSNLKSLIPA